MTPEEASNQVWDEIVSEYAEAGVFLQDEHREQFEDTFWFQTRVFSIQLDRLQEAIEPHFRRFYIGVLCLCAILVVFHAARYFAQ